MQLQRDLLATQTRMNEELNRELSKLRDEVFVCLCLCVFVFLSVFVCIVCACAVVCVSFPRPFTVKACAFSSITPSFLLSRSRVIRLPFLFLCFSFVDLLLIFCLSLSVYISLFLVFRPALSLLFTFNSRLYLSARIFRSFHSFFSFGRFFHMHVGRLV